VQIKLKEQSMPRKAFDPQRFNSAVRTIALYRAKKTVQAQIRARGQRISDYSCRDISLLANEHFAQHKEELINIAAQVVATFPEFSRYGCANLVTNAQNQSRPKSTTSAVQNSCSKVGAQQ
jgi:hypothetical protein